MIFLDLEEVIYVAIRMRGDQPEVFDSDCVSALARSRASVLGQDATRLALRRVQRCA